MQINIETLNHSDASTEDLEFEYRELSLDIRSFGDPDGERLSRMREIGKELALHSKRGAL